MVSVDQFCDGELMEEMAASGCIGVAVGVESVDDDNCAAVSKYQNLGRSVAEAARWAGECGMQVALLLIVGLPHDTPSRIERTAATLREIPCTAFDVRILRVFPGSDMYDAML